jgi:flagellar protein FliO/FliZ
MNGGRKIVALAAALFASVAFGADDNTVIFPGASRTEKPAMSASGNALNSMSLIVGLALAATGGWMVWRHRRGTPVGREQRALAIEETRSLGNRQFLVVASYEGKKFLLGVCQGRIDLLSNLDGATPAKARE